RPPQQTHWPVAIVLIAAGQCMNRARFLYRDRAFWQVRGGHWQENALKPPHGLPDGLESSRRESGKK
ncbi:hypothetical protein, partial [Phyllobacterium sp.]|uniref:hypothetical protein n=1 Tax=Phyllobacterium sp. TaxID=1871046 RepID=UPI0031FD5AAB|nr:hypothetical protein [Phyllobacterium sp.]